MLGKFEIREYIDDSGSRLRHEMVDLNAEMKGLQQYLESQRSKLDEQNATVEQREAFDALAAKLTAVDSSEGSTDEKPSVSPS